MKATSRTPGTSTALALALALSACGEDLNAAYEGGLGSLPDRARLDAGPPPAPPLPDLVGVAPYESYDNPACSAAPTFGAVTFRVTAVSIPPFGPHSFDIDENGVTDVHDYDFNEFSRSLLLLLDDGTPTAVANGSMIVVGELTGAWSAAGTSGVFLNLYEATTASPPGAGGERPTCDDIEEEVTGNGRGTATRWDGAT